MPQRERHRAERRGDQDRADQRAVHRVNHAGDDLRLEAVSEKMPPRDIAHHVGSDQARHQRGDHQRNKNDEAAAQDLRLVALCQRGDKMVQSQRAEWHQGKIEHLEPFQRVAPFVH